MVITVVMSLLLATITGQRTLRQQTDAHEAVRVPAAIITQDARFAYKAMCGFGDFLQLALNTTGTNYVIYQFANANGDPDPGNLHRVLVGGAQPSDEIVAWNLVSDQNANDFTAFACAYDPRQQVRTASAHLVRQPVGISQTSIALDIMASLRSN